MLRAEGERGDRDSCLGCQEMARLRKSDISQSRRKITGPCTISFFPRVSRRRAERGICDEWTGVQYQEDDNLSSIDQTAKGPTIAEEFSTDLFPSLTYTHPQITFKQTNKFPYTCTSRIKPFHAKKTNWLPLSFKLPRYINNNIVNAVYIINFVKSWLGSNKPPIWRPWLLL